MGIILFLTIHPPPHICPGHMYDIRSGHVLEAKHDYNNVKSITQELWRYGLDILVMPALR